MIRHIWKKLSLKSVNLKSISVFLPIICFVVSGLFSFLLGQDSNWDLRNYHFYNAYAFLNSRLLFDMAPAKIQTFLNPMMDVPIFLLIMNFSPVLVGFIIGGIQGINIWLTYKIALSVFTNIPERNRHLLSFAVSVTGYLGAANISEIGTTFGDNITSLFVLAALFMIVSSMKTDEMGYVMFTKKSLIISGLLFGMGTGLKLVLAVYSLSFLSTLLLMRAQWKPKLRNIFISVVTIGAGISATAGYWMVFMWRNFSNPLFPFYNNVFKSKFYIFQNFTDPRFFPRDIYEKLFYPFSFIRTQSLVGEMPFRDSRLAICYVLIIVSIIVYGYKRAKKSNLVSIEGTHRSINAFGKRGLLLIIFSVMSYIIWQLNFSIYRYVLPLEFLSPIVVVLTVGYIIRVRKYFIMLSAVLLSLIVITEQPMKGWGRVPWTNDFFGVRLSSHVSLEHSMVIMPGNYPLSYVIPYFPETSRFIGVENNFTNHSFNTLSEAEIRAVLQQDFPKYILYKESSYKNDNVLNEVLSNYHLIYKKENCERLHTKIDNELFLCKISKVPQNNR